MSHVANPTPGDVCLLDPRSLKARGLKDKVRARLEQLIAEEGYTLAYISRLLGKNESYIHQFLYRSTPKRLSEFDRIKLSELFGISEEELGGPRRDFEKSKKGSGLMISSLRLNENKAPTYCCFDSLAFGAASALDFDALRHVEIEDDCMYPTLAEGALAVVDTSVKKIISEGIFVLRQNDCFLVRRIAINPANRYANIKCDNKIYSSWEDVDTREIDIVGRLIIVLQRV